MARNSEKEREGVRGAVWWPELATKSGWEREGRVLARDCKDEREGPSNGERARGTEKEHESPINSERESERDRKRA